MTVATGVGDTVSVACPEMPSTVARMTAVPVLNAEMVPVEVTVATAGDKLVHATGRPVKTSPAWLRATAAAVVPCPGRTVLAANETATSATGTGATVTVVTAAMPSTVPLMTADPGATARTRPVPDTTATVGALDAHCTGRPAISTPPASRTTSVKSRVSPTNSCGGLATKLTVDTAAPCTTTAALPSRPSAEAKSTPAPGETPVTVPSAVTEKNAGAPLSHVIARCASTAPEASSASAVTRCVAPVCSVTVAGDTRTEATGDTLTVTVAVPLRPSLNAEITALPGELAVTVPSAATRATAPLLLRNATGRPVSRVPLSSVTCTVRRSVCPTVSADCDGDTMTAPTGRGNTRTIASPLRPPLDAVIVTVPGATPSTRPDDDTVATPAALELHPNTRSANAAPPASRATAVSCVDCPTMRLSRDGESCTVAVGTGNTVTPMAAVRFSLAAVMVATPAASPLTTPLAFTIATAGALDCQSTARSRSACPRSSTGVASSGSVPFTTSDGFGGDNWMLATARRDTLTTAIALLPSADTDTRAVPARSAATSPVAVTRTTAVSLLDQSNGRSLSGRPNSSNSRACNTALPPSTTDAAVGDTVTELTGTSSGLGAVISLTPAQAVSRPPTSACTTPRVNPRICRVTMRVITAPASRRGSVVTDGCGSHRRAVPQR